MSFSVLTSPSPFESRAVPNETTNEYPVEACKFTRLIALLTREDAEFMRLIALLTRAEFVQMMAMELRKSKPIREQDLVYACELIDRDKNGRISLQVCCPALSLSYALLPILFAAH